MELHYIHCCLFRAEQKEAKKIEKEKKEEEAKKIEKEAAAKNGDATKKNAEAKEQATAESAAKNGDIPKKNGDGKNDKPKEVEKPKEEEKKVETKATPLYPRPAQNWSDLFFILDSLSYNIDMCDIILFMTKICPVSGLENKKVNVDISYLDTTSNTLVVSHTGAGVLENLLGNT